ncbi:hypothetical protein OBK28_09345 [Empedobacter falsenii]
MSKQNRQLKGIFCIQYPVYCIHAEISDSTPDSLENLDRVIIEFIKVKEDITAHQIGSLIGTSKSLIQLRIEKLVRDKLIIHNDNGYYLSELGIEVFNTKESIRLHRQSYDFYIDGITQKPLPKIFYNYYSSKLISEEQSSYKTNTKTCETYIVKPFAPDFIHTPPEKKTISKQIFAIDKEDREEYEIPKGLESIEEISFTKMTFQILVAVSQSKDNLIKELIDGHAIYSLKDEHSYYETLRKNVIIFEDALKDRIINLEFKLQSPYQKKDSLEKLTPFLTTNLSEIDRYENSENKCFSFSTEDLIAFIDKMFGLKHISSDCIVNNDASIEVKINKQTLENSYDRKKLINDLIRKRDYRIFSNSLEKNVFLFYLYYSTDDQVINEVIEFIELFRQYEKYALTQFLKSNPKYNDSFRYFLVLAGEYDILEKYDIEMHMLKLN